MILGRCHHAGCRHWIWFTPESSRGIGLQLQKQSKLRKKAGRHLEVVAVVTGTDDDPQGLRNQIAQMEAAGAWVSTCNEEIVRYAGAILQGIESQ